MGWGKARQAMSFVIAAVPRPARDLMLAFLLWRSLLYLVAYVSHVIVPSDPGLAPTALLESVWNLLFGWWVHWDAAWYLSIIMDGYSYYGPGVQANVAFFPLYPLAVRLVASVLRGGLGDYKAAVTAGVLVSNLCGLLAVWFLYLLTRDEMQRKGRSDAEGTAMRAALLFLFFPTTVFFASVYTEGLFVLLVILSCYHLRQGRFLIGGILGGAAAACRITGILLLVPFAIEYVRRWQLRPRKEVLSLVLIALGLASYSLYLYMRFGEPFAYLRVQSAPGWHGTIEGFPFYRSLSNVYHFMRDPRNVWWFLEISYAGGILALTGLSLRYLPLSLGTYALLACLVPLAADTFSMQRYVLGVFPAFMMLGIVGKSQKAFFVLSSVFVCMLGVSTLMWMSGKFLG